MGFLFFMESLGNQHKQYRRSRNYDISPLHLLQAELGVYQYLNDTRDYGRPNNNIGLTEVDKRLQSGLGNKKYAAYGSYKNPIYTGVRVTECIKIKIEDIDLNLYWDKIIEGKGKKKTRIVPFPHWFRKY